MAKPGRKRSKKAARVRQPHIAKAATHALPKFEGEAPTDELLRSRPFGVVKVRLDGPITGTPVFRHQPRYMELAKKTKPPLTSEEIAALDLYRETGERADRSLVKSCLDLDSDGRPRRPDAITHINAAVRQARDMMRLVDKALGPFAATLRAVALDDRSLSDIAIERFGSRKVEWLVDADDDQGGQLVEVDVVLNGKPVLAADGEKRRQKVFKQKIVPRSNTHPTIIRDEFHHGVKMLLASVRGGWTDGVEEVWVGHLESGGARIYRGIMAPKGPYRVRGLTHAVDAAFDDLTRLIGSELQFGTYDLAKAALQEAALGRLIDIDTPEELVA